MWHCLNCEPLYGTCSCLDWISVKEEDDELLLGKIGFSGGHKHCVSSSLSLHKYHPSNSWGLLDLKNIVSSWETEQENTSENLFGTSILSLCLRSRSNVTLVHYYYFFHTCRRKAMGNLGLVFLRIPWPSQDSLPLFSGLKSCENLSYAWHSPWTVNISSWTSSQNSHSPLLAVIYEGLLNNSIVQSGRQYPWLSAVQRKATQCLRLHHIFTCPSWDT